MHFCLGCNAWCTSEKEIYDTFVRENADDFYLAADFEAID